MDLELDEICGAAPEEENQSVGNYAGDHKPEYFQYKDEGCQRAPSCLACPFHRCFYEKSTHNRRSGFAARDKEIARLHREGRKVRGLARLFKVKPWTVYQAIKKYKNLERVNDE